jgi:hypothetical protein
MIPAYDETYLPDAMANLAGAFDYALNDCGLPVGLFMDFFATSEAAALFGRGTPKYVCGMSGEELVAEIMRQTGWARILASRTARRLNTRILGRMGTRILPMGQGSAVLGHSRCAVARRYRATAPDSARSRRKPIRRRVRRAGRP